MYQEIFVVLFISMKNLITCSVVEIKINYGRYIKWERIYSSTVSKASNQTEKKKYNMVLVDDS